MPASSHSHHLSTLQARLDENRSMASRNQNGQYATPPALAAEIADFVATHYLDNDVRLLEPSAGIGALIQALFDALNKSPHQMTGRAFELDKSYFTQGLELWSGKGIAYTNSDFTTETPDPSYNLVFANPPYVRHHHLSSYDKTRLNNAASKITSHKFSKLTGMYCYFMIMAHCWLEEDGIGVWLIPSEFMDVNYGVALKRWLMQEAELLHLHRYRPEKGLFGDAMVSSCVVIYRKSSTHSTTGVRFSYGSSIGASEIFQDLPQHKLAATDKWSQYAQHGLPELDDECTTIGDFFNIRRGLVTGNNKYFVVDRMQAEKYSIPTDLLSPILPSARHLPDDILTDPSGVPYIERPLFLFSSRLSTARLLNEYPDAARYLQLGLSQGVNEGYICRTRTPWYNVEHIAPPPIVCTYMGRRSQDTSPFRFIRNHSNAVINNSLLGLYPKPTLQQAIKNRQTNYNEIMQQLRSIPPEKLIARGRVYGGGLHKLEPKELSNIPLDLPVPTTTALRLF